MKIRIEDSLEITLEWNCSSLGKDTFLYLVAFKLAKGKANNLSDIIFRDLKKDDGLDYSGVQKAIYSSSTTLTQKLKLNTNRIRNAIDDIYVFFFSFKNENITKGKIILKCDGKKIEHKYGVSNPQQLCIEFGHMKRCSDYWELDLYTQEYKSIEIPYRTFANKNLKNEYPASEVFNLKKEVNVKEENEGMSIDQGVIPLTKPINKPSVTKHDTTYGTMPLSSIRREKYSSGQTNNTNKIKDTTKTPPRTKEVPAESTITDNKTCSKKRKPSMGLMPNKKKK